ncbi:glycoside hydrolase family 55 protein [Xylariaceae sp. FL1272]|nr:glycoside hydrolase family 55 protein [Xylariaceae sp. FL1272]
MTGSTSISDANATVLGPNVYVFDTSMPMAAIQDAVTALFKQMEANEFGNERYALLFKPGTYDVLFDVGFYTHVAGLGRSPDDVQIEGGVNVPAYWMPSRNATCNFWRTFENFAINASSATNHTTTIAVSQAAPIRRMHIKSSGGLWLFQVDPDTGAGGWASGGFMADSVVDNTVLPGSQQQWLSRNNKYGNWANGVWNMVFVGDADAPSQDNFPATPYTTILHTPVIREKPYLLVTEQGQFEVFKPALQAEARGPSWLDGKSTPGTSIPIDDFYVAKPDDASAASVNQALSSGKHILFTPGIYKLDDAIHVIKADTIILGLGQPSLVPVNGHSAIKVDDVSGVTIAGLIIDAGEVLSPTLIEIGPEASCEKHAENPTFLSDLTVRTAGGCKNDVGIAVNSHNVVGDQLWLWRADHGEGAAWDLNPTRNGIVVNGDDVVIYGLFNEHHKEYQTLWNGDRGRLYFYQSEIPYDPPNQQSWMCGNTNGFASYKVADGVKNHEAWGLGIYSYFRDSPSKLENAVEVPTSDGIKLHHLTTVWLTGTPGSEITHIVNGAGERVYANTPETAMRQTVKEFPV